MKIFITGTPGTGKSTISLALKESLNLLDIFEMKDLLAKLNLLEEYDPDLDTNLFDEKKATKEIQVYLELKNDFILVGPPLNFDNLIFDYVIVLTCSKKVILQDRLKLRGYSQPKINENLEAELLGVILGQSMDFFESKTTLLIYDSCESTIEQLLPQIIENIHT